LAAHQTNTTPPPLLLNKTTPQALEKMNLFFPRKPKATPKDSIVELRNTLQMLEKRETFLQTKIDNELKIAKANAAKNRRCM